MRDARQVPIFRELVFRPREHDYVVVIPVINEGERIRKQLARLAALSFPADIVIADGGSTDGSLEPDFLRSCGVSALLVKTGPGRLSAQLRMAYAWCLERGYAGIVTVDGNGKDGLEAIPLFLNRLRDGFDLVQGSRYVRGGKAINTPLDRKLAGRLIHAPLLSLAGGRWFTDTTNGFRAYSAKYLRDPELLPFRDVFHSYALLFYLTMRAGQLGYRTCEVPVSRSYPAREKVPTKISGFRGRADMMKELLDVVCGLYNPADPAPEPPASRNGGAESEPFKRSEKRNASLHLIALLFLIVATTLHIPFDRPLTDAFQEGEYAAFGLLAQTQPGFHMPVLIHGGLDVVPSQIAALSCPADRQIICVRTINAVFQLGAVGLFAAVLITLAGLGTWAAMLAGIPAAAMLWFYNGAAPDAVNAQLGSPSVRDLFVMAGLLVMARISRTLDRGEVKIKALPLFVLGGLTTIGLFWAYNRGLALMLDAGAFTILLCLLTRSPRSLLFAGAGAIAGLAAAAAAGGEELFRDTLFNIEYWVRNASIWHTPLHRINVTPIMAMGLLTFVCALPAAWASVRSNMKGRALMLTVLFVMFASYFAQTLNRPLVADWRWVMWPATLILAIAIRAMADKTRDLPRGSGGVTLAVILLLAVGCEELYSSNSILLGVVRGLTHNARAATKAMPTDLSLVDPDLARVAELVAAKGRCTFAANNAGIVYLLSRMPPCSRFAFGTYVARDRQAEVIAALQVGQPEIILWDSSRWYSNIDGLSFQDRTPILAGWIEEHYPIRTAIGQQVLLSRTPLSH